MLLSYFMYAILTLLSIIIDIRIVYIIFMILALGVVLKKRKFSEMIIVIAIYSLIVPDNYLTEALFVMYFIIKFAESSNGKERQIVKLQRYHIIYLVFAVWILFSSLINVVSGVQIFFSIISFLPFTLFLFNAYGEKNNILMDIKPYIDKVLFVEVVATCANFVKYMGTEKDDWSTGTFGIEGGQLAQLFIVMAYMVIYYVSYYKGNWRKSGMLIRVCSASTILITTHCWTMLGVMFIGIALWLLYTLNYKKFLVLLITIALVPIGLPAAKSVLPAKIVSSVTRAFSDVSFFRYRFHKLQVYEETFVEIPSKDYCFCVFGNGIGNYCSRAALICTGQYVDFYNRFFPPNISKYTDKYIMDYLSYANAAGGSDYGSVVARPYSSILALMGESGYVGCLLFLLLMLSLLKRKMSWKKLIIIIWLAFCLVENYFEYPKITLFLFICMSSAGSMKHLFREQKDIGAEIQGGDK